MIAALAPGLLIAAPSMTDPRFQGAVVLLAEASSDGALGFVINRTTPFTFADLADDIGFDIAEDVRTTRVHYGGPVSPERGWILFRDPEAAEEPRDNVLRVTSELHLAATLEVLGDFVTARNTAPFKLLLGYAGWAPQQLEGELREGAWIPLELEPDLLFAVDIDEIYESALERLGLKPGGFVMGSGGTA